MTADLALARHHHAAQPTSPNRLNRSARTSRPALAWIHRRVAAARAPDRAQEAFTVFADVARHPAFAQEELDRAKQQAARRPAKVALSQPGSIARLSR